MEARTGKRVAVMTFCTCLLAVTSATTTGCGVGQAGGGDAEAYKALPAFDGLPGTLVHNLVSMAVGVDFDTPPAE